MGSIVQMEKQRINVSSGIVLSLKFVNRICPNCKNPNYMVSLGDFAKVYKYKCMNCNGYFNDIDFEKEPLQPDWKTWYMNKKVDMVEVVRCKDCVHGRVYAPNCVDCELNELAKDEDWFCSDGKRRENT